MNTLINRFIIGEPHNIASIGQLRLRILNELLVFSAVFFGTALGASFLIPGINIGLSGISILYATLYVWLLVILFVRRIPYIIRSGSWAAILFALGIINLFLSGFNIISGMLFLSFIVTTTFLMGLRFGEAALLISGVTLSIIGGLSVIGVINPELKIFNEGPLLWIYGGLMFLLTGIFLSIPLAALINSLDYGLIKATSLAEKLEQSNAAIRANEERFRAMIEDSSDIISILKPDGTVQYISHSVEQILGYKIGELIGRKIFDYLHPEDQNIVVAALTPGIPAEVIGPSLELRIRHKDDSWRTLEVKGKEMHTHPAVNGTVINGRDITDRKEFENEIQESHQLLKKVFASLSSAVFILDAKTSIIKDCNPAASTMFGYSREDILGHTSAFLHTKPAALEEFRRQLISAIDEKGFLSKFEFQMKRRNGVIFPTEHSVMPLDDLHAGRIGWVSVVRDITEQKNLEQQLQKVNEGLEIQVAAQTRELQEREQIQHAILEATDQSIILLDLNGKILMANEIAAQRMKMVLQDFEGACVYDLLPAESSKPRRAIVEKVIRTGKPMVYADERQGILLETNLYPIFKRDGRVHRVVLFSRDVTIQKRTELALQESEEKYRALAEASHDMIFVVNEDDQVEYINSHAASILQLKLEDVIGKPQSVLFPDAIAERQREGIKAAIASNSPKYSENWITFGQGEPAYISTWLVPLGTQGNIKRSVLGVSRDITAIQKMQEELISSHDQLEKRVAERTKELNDLSAAMRTLAKKVITTQEEERRRISRELHDDTGQLLVTLKYSLAEILNGLPAGDRTLHNMISHCINATDTAMTNIRATAHSLRPPLLDAGGLNISLKDFCQDINLQTKLKVDYQGTELDNLPDDIAVTLFRFVQEAFSNILKHARATQVSVKLQFIRQRIALSVSDNGVGIVDAQDTGGIGLVGLQERIGFLGGKLQLKSPPGKGTTVKAVIPWQGRLVEG